jgi:hypothetical protein
MLRVMLQIIFIARQSRPSGQGCAAAIEAERYLTDGE